MRPVADLGSAVPQTITGTTLGHGDARAPWYPRRMLRRAAPLLPLLALAACGSDPAAADRTPEPEPEPEPGAEVVFDEAVLRTYELTVAGADWAWLNDHALEEQYVPATLTVDGQRWENIGVRYKGAVGNLRLCFDQQGNRTCDKLSMKLKFNEYVPDQRFYGLKRLNFHSMRSDPTAMHDRIAYGLFRASGVPAPRAVHARLVVNGELLGLFALVEAVDGVFTRDRFGGADGGEGNLYKEVWPVYTAPQPYLDALETNEDEDPSVDRMQRFAAALAQTDDAGFRATLEAWMDVPTLMRYLAVDRLIENWDGIVAWYCHGGACFNHNYYWYEQTDRDRVWLVPWDMDNTFVTPSPVRQKYGIPDWNEIPATCDPIPIFLNVSALPPACDDLIRRLATVTWADYQAATAELLAGPASQPEIDARIDFIKAQIAPAVAEDPNGTDPLVWQSAVEHLRKEMPVLRARVAP